MLSQQIHRRHCHKRLSKGQPFWNLHHKTQLFSNFLTFVFYWRNTKTLTLHWIGESGRFHSLYLRVENWGQRKSNKRFSILSSWWVSSRDNEGQLICEESKQTHATSALGMWRQTLWKAWWKATLAQAFPDLAYSLREAHLSSFCETSFSNSPFTWNFRFLHSLDS